ncbi:MAG: phosphate acyltransferase PlsX, partial [Clostridia bacterium]|nr:phosphate acyltransferase PlsX [Clostridia bacterium]
KKDASINIATRLVKDGKAAALVSAGNTGAQMASALIMLGRMRGVHRPAIAAVIPGIDGPKILLDAGANTDCGPNNLMEFAIMGNVYAEKVLGISNASVGLLNIGSEPYKGDQLTKAAYDLLCKSQLNFYGNIEAGDMLGDSVDVVVCDGFVGNSLLKFGEGLGHLFYSLLYEAVGKSLFTKAGGLLLLPGVKEIQNKLDWQEYGGAPLLGVNGVSIVCHGGSKAKAVKNAIRVARNCVENKFAIQLQESFSEEKVRACHMG